MSDLLTSKQVQGLFNVTAMTLCNWRKKRKIPFIQVGHTIRYRRSDIRKILNGFNTQKNIQEEETASGNQ